MVTSPLLVMVVCIAMLQKYYTVILVQCLQRYPQGILRRRI